MRGFVEFVTPGLKAGSYLLNVAYANPGKQDAAQMLAVNGGDAHAAAFASTGGRFKASRDPHGIKSVPVTLKEGEKTIRLTYEGDGYMELDYVDIIRDDPGQAATAK